MWLKQQKIPMYTNDLNILVLFTHTWLFQFNSIQFDYYYCRYMSVEKNPHRNTNREDTLVVGGGGGAFLHLYTCVCGCVCVIYVICFASSAIGSRQTGLLNHFVFSCDQSPE